MAVHVEHLSAPHTHAEVVEPGQPVIEDSPSSRLAHPTHWGLTLSADEVVCIHGTRPAILEVLRQARAALMEYVEAEHENGYHRDQPEPGCQWCEEGR